jgi:arylsulfatase A-like enzyme
LSPPRIEWSQRRVGDALAVSAGLVAALLCGCASGPGHTIVLIVLDTVRQDALGCYGNPDAPTPHIDALARDGVRFERAISSSGWTLPSVASLLTGAWPTIHGALGRGTALTPIRDELPTAAELLRDHGYGTFGFANAAFVSPMLRLDRGFDVFDHVHTFNWDSRRADATVDALLPHLREHPSRARFFLVHLFDPHLDYDPPPGYEARFTGGRAEPAPPLTHAACTGMQGPGDGSPSPEDARYVRGVYLGEVSFMDAQIGRLVDELEALQLYEAATIIVTADHGEEFWEHGGFEHGHSLYDELVLVPLIIKFPSRRSTAGVVVDEQVRLLDVMPTVFEDVGVEVPDSFEGRSLLPLVTGEDDADRPAYCESTLYGAQRIAWLEGRYKYIHSWAGEGAETGELYDVESDPGETRDLSTASPEIAERLRGELLAFHRDLVRRAGAMSRPSVVDMSPREVEKLKSLGYIR